MDFEIAIPSYKRPNNCKTAKLFSKGIIYCHDSEVEEYKKFNSNEIRPIPDELAGKGMAVIRNFILSKSTEKLVMIDDDMDKFGYHETGAMHTMGEDEVYGLIEMGFQMAEDMGTKLWGVNLQSDKKFYREYSPVSLSSVILGPFMGIIQSPELRFDDRLGLKEDYDYSLQVLRLNRKILRLNKYYYVSGHIKVKGGCASYRTKSDEEDQAKLFQKKWGKNIVRINRKTQGGNISINPVVIVPIKGI